MRGTGLGLSLSKRLAELLGGSVGVRSTPGSGSTFMLSIPMTAPGFELTADGADVKPAVLRDAPMALIVDDEQTARYLLRHSLMQIGCRVIEAMNGESGLLRAAIFAARSTCLI